MKNHVPIIKTSQVTVLEGLHQDKALAHALDILKAINNADKHRALHILGVAGTEERIEFIGLKIGAGQTLVLKTATLPPNMRMVDGAEALRIPVGQFGGQAQVQVNFAMTANFMFDTPREARGGHLGYTMGMAVSCTELALDALAPTF